MMPELANAGGLDVVRKMDNLLLKDYECLILAQPETPSLGTWGRSDCKLELIENRYIYICVCVCVCVRSYSGRRPLGQKGDQSLREELDALACLSPVKELPPVKLRFASRLCRRKTIQAID